MANYTNELKKKEKKKKPQTSLLNIKIILFEKGTF